MKTTALLPAKIVLDLCLARRDNLIASLENEREKAISIHRNFLWNRLFNKNVDDETFFNEHVKNNTSILGCQWSWMVALEYQPLYDHQQEIAELAQAAIMFNGNTAMMTLGSADLKKLREPFRGHEFKYDLPPVRMCI